MRAISVGYRYTYPAYNNLTAILTLFGDFVYKCGNRSKQWHRWAAITHGALSRCLYQIRFVCDDSGGAALARNLHFLAPNAVDAVLKSW